MSSPGSGGTSANRAGRRLIKFVVGVLEDRGYEYVRSSQFIPMRKMKQPIYTCHKFNIGKDIYGNIRHADVILYHPHLYSSCLVIQCIWQGIVWQHRTKVSI